MSSLSAWGSSPQARGTRGFGYLPRTRQGIIPAGAGNSVVEVGGWKRRGDHPRRRGELGEGRGPADGGGGSSPQARGTHGL